MAVLQAINDPTQQFVLKGGGDGFIFKDGYIMILACVSLKLHSTACMCRY